MVQGGAFGLGNPALRDRDGKRRVIVEFCCSEDSRLGRYAEHHSLPCKIIRITEAIDANSPEGISLALNGCRRRHALLWSSIPCTGGTVWQRWNRKRPGGEEKLQVHLTKFRELWRTFSTVARMAKAKGTPIAIEWPRGCDYWSWPEVSSLIQELRLKMVNFEGCALGLTSVVTGLPIKKPWRIATDCNHIIEAFWNCRCSGTCEHSPCAGRDTKRTEGTPRSLLHSCTVRMHHT